MWVSTLMHKQSPHTPRQVVDEVLQWLFNNSVELSGLNWPVAAYGVCDAVLRWDGANDETYLFKKTQELK